MENLIFDSHAHYTSPIFNKDRDELLTLLLQKNVNGIVDCATDLTTAKESIVLTEKYDYIYSAIGIHPQSLIEEDSSTLQQFKGDWKKEMDDLQPLYSNPKVVAVGECGLDYHWPVPKIAQNELFEAEIKLALTLDKPIIVHDREAHEDVYNWLKKYKPKGVVHCYSGSAQDAQWLVEQGMYIGFGGVITFKNARRALEALQVVPLDKLLLETDCPYLAPMPFRGKRCDSSMILYTAQKMAEIKQLDTATILQITNENARRLFNI